jgi:4-amino-4-deoxy-L-arabinose transferase-like glycosyltransferase
MVSFFEKKFWNKTGSNLQRNTVHPDFAGKVDVVIQLLFAFCLALFYGFQSPINPFEGADAGCDSSVFQYVGYLMHKGMMPYRDTFDHKGPVIYIINWLGQCISSQWGIWVIEVIFLTAAFGLFYRIARLCAGRLYSYATVLICASLLFDYFDRGNLVEEYALPFLAGALLIFLDYFIHEKITVFRLLLCGFSFGVVLLLRPNMIAIWVVCCIAVFLKEAKNRGWNKIGKFLIFFLLGAGVILIPILAWLAAGGALPDFWADYVVFNKIYSAAGTGTSVWGGRLRAFIIFVNNPVCLLAAGIMLFWLGFERKRVDVVNVLCLLCSLIFVTIAGRAYGHYGMVLIPLYVYPLASVEQIGLLLTGNLKKTKMLSYMFACVLLVSAVLPDMILTSYQISLKVEDRNSEHRSATTLAVGQLIDERTEESDRITVYGNWDLIYTTANRVSASKYSYQYPLGEVLPEIKQEYFEELEQSLPKIVVIEAGQMDDDMQSFLDSNLYEKIWEESDGGAAVYGL